jgi:hypothetical protein
MKTDQRIKNIVVAAIRRASMDMSTWVHTRLWDEGDLSLEADLCRSCHWESSELPILYLFVDETNWTVITTRRIVYSVNGDIDSVRGSHVVRYWWGNFKGYGGQIVEQATLRTEGDEEHHCLFETGAPSMGSIYAIRTMCQLTRRPDDAVSSERQA